MRFNSLYGVMSLIKSKISFLDYYTEVNAFKEKKKNSKNLICPVCGHQSLSLGQEGFAYCYCKGNNGCSCDFMGDIFELYRHVNKGSSVLDAVKFFAKRINLDLENKFASTEAINEMLFFFSECRQYFAFYNINVSDIKKQYSKINTDNPFLQIDTNQFYKVLNGEFVTHSMMFKVHTILKLHVTDDKLRKYRDVRDNKLFFIENAKEINDEIKIQRSLKKYFKELQYFFINRIKKS